MNRRNFLTRLGIGAAVVAVAPRINTDELRDAEYVYDFSDEFSVDETHDIGIEWQEFSVDPKTIKVISNLKIEERNPMMYSFECDGDIRGGDTLIIPSKHTNRNTDIQVYVTNCDLDKCFFSVFNINDRVNNLPIGKELVISACVFKG